MSVIAENDNDWKLLRNYLENSNEKVITLSQDDIKEILKREPQEKLIVHGQLSLFWVNEPKHKMAKSWILADYIVDGYKIIDNNLLVTFKHKDSIKGNKLNALTSAKKSIANGRIFKLFSIALLAITLAGGWYLYNESPSESEELSAVEQCYVKTKRERERACESDPVASYCVFTTENIIGSGCTARIKNEYDKVSFCKAESTQNLWIECQEHIYSKF
jgi:hypothetical protein